MSLVMPSSSNLKCRDGSENGELRMGLSMTAIRRQNYINAQGSALSAERRQSGRRHSAIARNTNTATTPVPTAPMMAPTMVPIARSVLQSRRQPMSDQPYPMTAPNSPAKMTPA